MSENFTIFVTLFLISTKFQIYLIFEGLVIVNSKINQGGRLCKRYTLLCKTSLLTLHDFLHILKLPFSLCAKKFNLRQKASRNWLGSIWVRRGLVCGCQVAAGSYSYVYEGCKRRFPTWFRQALIKIYTVQVAVVVVQFVLSSSVLMCINFCLFQVLVRL